MLRIQLLLGKLPWYQLDKRLGNSQVSLDVAVKGKSLTILSEILRLIVKGVLANLSKEVTANGRLEFHNAIHGRKNFCMHSILYFLKIKKHTLRIRNK